MESDCAILVALTSPPDVRQLANTRRKVDVPPASSEDLDTVDVPKARSARVFFRGQGLHLGAVPLLCAIAWVFAAPSLDGGTFLGLDESLWFALTLSVPVLHQVCVWIVWRAQLGWQLFTRWFGALDMMVWGALFMPLLWLRPLFTIACAVADRGSAQLPFAVPLVLGSMCFVPALYTLYSVHRYFGLARAMGGDHFRRRYRDLPLVDQGAFAWTPNAMYTLGFLGLWGIALLANSRVALATAFFQHAYIWAHYLGTEEPDLRLIHTTSKASETRGGIGSRG